LAEPFYFEGHGFDVLLDVPTPPDIAGAAIEVTTVRVGHFGRVHPEVLANYKIITPVSSLELNLHDLL
jgi:hypothetical protein